MDPDVTLDRLQRMYRSILSTGVEGFHIANDMAELVEALDGWLSRGGFLPADWVRPILMRQLVIVNDPDGFFAGRVEGMDGDDIYVRVPGGELTGPWRRADINGGN